MAYSSPVCCYRIGFTMIELSIVLVIIGLIIGGVLVGRDLIRTAELRKIYKEYEQYMTAFTTFRTKYNCMPGDCPNATSFFPATADCVTWPLVGGTGVCNGNGDGQIYYAPDGFWLWQHLAHAGLVSGNFSGAGSISIVGSNVPASSYSPSVGWSMNWAYFPGSYDISSYVPGDWLKNRLVLGSSDGVWTGSPFISLGDIYRMDTKYDDGRPATGNITTMAGGTGGSCAAIGPTITDVNTYYASPAAAILCNMVFSVGEQ